MKTFIIVVIVAALGAAGVWWWFNRAGERTTVAYETAVTERGPLTMTVSASGTINPVATVIVGSQVSGRIQDLYADYNSVVTCGQVVAQLEQSPFITRVRQSEATVAKAKANVNLANATYERQRTLAAQHVTSSAELDDARAKHDQARADEMQAQASLDSANIDLQHATIYSPVDGMVLTRSVDVGQTVAASFQAPVLFTIAADLTKMQIEAKVDEADIGQVGVGQTVFFGVDAYPDLTFTGMVRQVRNSPQIVQNVVTYDTIITVDNSAMKLKPGMTATTTIEVSNRTDAIIVPNAALRMKLPPGAVAPEAAGDTRAPLASNQQTVYVLRGDRPLTTRVTTGITDGSQTEIVNGLEPGAEVIVGTATRGAGGQQSVNPFAGPRFGSARRSR